MMKYTNIPQFPRAHYEINVSWDSLEDNLERWINPRVAIAALNLDPDFQRAHVWTSDQRIKYLEYILKGGEVGRNIIFNCPGWMHTWIGPFELIDGKQRIETVRMFIRNEIPVFGYYINQFEDRIPYDLGFRFRVCDIKERKDILRLYLNINAGGTPHTIEELDRIRKIIMEEPCP